METTKVKDAAKNQKKPSNANTSLLQTLAVPTEKASAIFDVIFGLPAAQALHVAHELALFEIIAEHQALSLDEIAHILKLETRPAQALLSMCSSISLLTINAENKYILTDLASHFLLKKSPFYIGGALDITLFNGEIYSFKSFKQALMNNASQVYQGKELFKTNEEQNELAKIFTHAMHGKSMAMANVWPKKIDLTAHKLLLDIGGGSGAHSITAVAHNPHLNALIYERPVVCDVANGYIQQFGLEQRIKTNIGDMWKDPFPTADLHFYSDIFHDWSLEKCQFLIEKSYQSLKPNGRILIHEMLFNQNKQGPASVSAYNIVMLLWTESGQQFSLDELSHMLKKVGFRDIQAIPTGFGDWSLLSGLK